MRPSSLAKLINIFPFKKGNIRTRLKQRTSILSEQIEQQVKEKDLILKIHKIFNAVYHNEFSSGAHSRTSVQNLLKQVSGYSLRKAKSSISDQAGYGVFLDGKIEEASLVCLYPGTTYLPGDVIFFSSIRNDFLLRRYDGCYVDGRPYGFSARVFRSCSMRDNLDTLELSESTWLNYKRMDANWRTVDDKVNEFDEYKNPLSVGHVINHSNTPNVMYFELDIPISKNNLPAHIDPNLVLPTHLRQYLPNVYYNMDAMGSLPVMKTVVLVTLRNIENEELFTHYCFVGRKHK